MGLDGRLATTISKCEDAAEKERLTTQQTQLRHTSLMKRAMVAFVSSTEDLARAKATNEQGGGTLVSLKELERLNQYYCSILSSQDWQAQYAEKYDAVEAMVAELERGRDEQLSHDVRFKDADHKAAEIARLEAKFAGAELHERFEALLTEARRVMPMAKHFEGHIKIEEPQKHPFLKTISQRVLQALLAAARMPFAVQGVNETVTWVESGGLRYEWDINFGPTGVKLEHTLPVDMRDVGISTMQMKFLEAYHAIKERLASLDQLATQEDANKNLVTFECACDEGFCVVCQDEMVAGETVTRMACGHTFHQECIGNWLLGCKQECPTCKAPLDYVPQPRSRVGEEVELVGLLGRADLNGRRGTIVAFLEERQRYEVKLYGADLTDEQARVAVKEGNLVTVEA